METQDHTVNQSEIMRFQADPTVLSMTHNVAQWCVTGVCARSVCPRARTASELVPGETKSGLLESNIFSELSLMAAR